MPVVESNDGFLLVTRSVCAVFAHSCSFTLATFVPLLGG